MNFGQNLYQWFLSNAQSLVPVSYTHLDVYKRQEVEIINADSGFVVNKGLFPYESINMTYEDWQTSQSEDVTSSSELEGYDRIKATITEITCLLYTSHR